MARKKNGETRHPHTGRKRMTLGIAAVCALVALLVGVLVIFPGGKTLDVTVGGQQVQPELFDQIMQQQVSEVVYECGQMGLHSNDPGFWQTVQDGTTPGEMLTERTLQQLRTLTAMYDMAQETGTPLHGGLNGVLDRMETENQSREEKKEAGQPVYGLTEFTFETFLEYEMDWMEKQYCANPDNPGMEVTDEDREAYYQQNRETAFQLPDGISLSYVYLDTNFMDAPQGQELKAQLAELEQAMEDGAQLERAVEEYPDLVPYFAQLDLEPEQVGSYADSLGDVLDLAYELEPGTHSGVVESNGGVYLVQCTARTYDHYMDLEEVSDSIDETLRQQRYEQMVKSRGERVEVAGNEEEILAYVIERMTGKK